jgi:cytochrome d ubiquinol oxidase subunit II
VISALSGLAALVLLQRSSPRLPRGLAVVAVASIVAGWGVAQYPNLLGTHMTLAQAAAPAATLWSVFVVFVAAGLICGPSLALLYVLHQRGRLESV